MIIASLANAYDRLKASGANIVPIGFKEYSGNKAVVVTIDADGGIIGSAIADKERRIIAPGSVRTSGVDAILLFDKASYMLSDPEHGGTRGHKEHASCLVRHHGLSEDAKALPRVAALIRFLERGHEWRAVFTPGIVATMVERKAYDLGAAERDLSANGQRETERIRAIVEGRAMPDDAWVVIRMEGDSDPICSHPEIIESPAIMSAINSANTIILDGNPMEGFCTVSGKASSGLARVSSLTLVSFNSETARSFEAKGRPMLNAPIDLFVAQKAATALDYLRWAEDYHFPVGDFTFVFFSDAVDCAKVGRAVRRTLARAAETTTDPKAGEMSATFRGLRKQVADLAKEANTPYVLACIQKASKGRENLVHFERTTVGVVAQRLAQHFDDLEITGRDDGERWPTLWRMVIATLPASSLKNGQPKSTAIADLCQRRQVAMLSAILFGRTYPLPILSAILDAARSDSHRGKDDKGTKTSAMTGMRAALLRAWITRHARVAAIGAPLMNPELDRNDRSPGYLAGRLLALLEYVQYKSQTIDGGKPSGKGVADLYFDAALRMPGGVLPNILGKAKKAWLPRLKAHGKGGIEIDIEAVTAAFANGVIPLRLDLTEQARFAVGYYLQRQQRFVERGGNKNESGVAVEAPPATDNTQTPEED